MDRNELKEGKYREEMVMLTKQAARKVVLQEIEARVMALHPNGKVRREGPCGQRANRGSVLGIGLASSALLRMGKCCNHDVDIWLFPACILSVLLFSYPVLL